MILGFSQILKDYNDNQVTDAFQKWMREARDLPTPSDILAICEQNRKHERNHCPETMNARDMASQREAERIRDIKEKSKTAPMSPEQFSAWLREAKETTAIEEGRKQPRGKINTTHFDRMTEQQKADFNKQAVLASKKKKY